jgi:hypothetical protein
MNLPPHLIKESIELQEARNTLNEMSRPISQISQSIQSSARGGKWKNTQNLVIHT